MTLLFWMGLVTRKPLKKDVSRFVSLKLKLCLDYFLKVIVF
jgi:hypothetical protein